MNGETNSEHAGASTTNEPIVRLWAEAFEREVDPHDGFFELGGDSFTASVIAGAVRDRFDLDLDMRIFLSNPTAATIAALIEQRGTLLGDDGPPPLVKAARTGPLSSIQSRLWKPDSMHSTDRASHVALAYIIRGPLDVETLRRSVEAVIRRHEILRTTFKDDGGRPIAVVRPPESIELPVEDLREDGDADARAEQIRDSETLAPFDLEQGPLVRIRLLRVDQEQYQLLWVTHHLIQDAHSSTIFLGELALTYEALQADRPSPLPDEPPLQYIDYAAWERASLRPGSRRYEAELAWWQRTLERPLPAPRLPFERQPGDSSAQGAGSISWGIPAELSRALDAIGRETAATHYMTRLAAFSALISLETGVDELVVGTPASLRTRAQLHNMVGVFLNFAPLRLRFVGDPTFRTWLSDVRRVVIDTSAHIAIPAPERVTMLRKRGIAAPVITARFVAWTSMGATRSGEIELEPLPRRPPAGGEFGLDINRPYESDRCWVTFDPKLHDPQGITQFLSRLQRLIAASCAEPDQSLRDLHSVVSLA